MSKQTPSKLIRSQTYFNILYPYMNELHCIADSCPLQRQFAAPPSRVTKASIAHASLASASMSKLTKSTDSLRAFNFNTNPLWRHSAHKSSPHQQQQQQQRPHLRRHRLPAKTAVNAIAAAPLTPVKSLSPDLEPNLSHGDNELIMQRSLPIFEVLPPFTTSDTQNLLYQNSYLLDGVKYVYNAEEGQSYGGNSRLRLDYMKFLKSINAKAKPSDRDVIFGNAKVLLANKLGWERSRIDWLLDLERRQEIRRNGRKQAADQDEDDDGVVHICCLPFTKEMLLV